MVQHKHCKVMAISNYTLVSTDGIMLPQYLTNMAVDLSVHQQHLI